MNCQCRCIPSAALVRYRADGMRIEKVVNGETVVHIWDGSNIVLDVDGDDGVVIDRYIRGITLLASDVHGYYLYNAHGDVVQLADGSGVIMKDYDYDAFGVQLDSDGGMLYTQSGDALFEDADTNPWRYCGEYFDVETNTIYLRARYYDPVTGRFSSEDPIRDGLNWYTYCIGNPVRYYDPDGLFLREIYKGIKSAIEVVVDVATWTWDHVLTKDSFERADEIIEYGQGKGILEKAGLAGLLFINAPFKIYDALSANISHSLIISVRMRHGGAISGLELSMAKSAGDMLAGNIIGNIIVAGFKGLSAMKQKVTWTGQNFDDIAKSTTPDELINSLEGSGWTKVVETGGAKSGPATILTDPATGVNVRVHATPGTGSAYFRVQNAGGNYLGSDGAFPSNATKTEIGDLTHFYFK